MAVDLAVRIIAIACIVFNAAVMIWLVFQCAHFVNNPKYRPHQAFKIRGKAIFLATAVVLILNFIFRPILVSLSLVPLIGIDSGFWRGVMDFIHMSLYAIVEFRCWMTYFNLNSSTAIVDKQWKQYLDNKSKTESPNDCFLYCQSVLGRSLYVGSFFAMHGILCVVICDLVETNLGVNPDRLICHFFAANILLFILFFHRMYISYTRVKHTYSHDMLGINRELNLTTLIMIINAICDSILGVFVESPNLVVIPYIVYHSLSLAFLSMIIFYLPRRIIDGLLEIEKRPKQTGITLPHVFNDPDLYHGFIRYTLEEWSAENIIFITHWMQIQKIIVDSGIQVKVNKRYTCERSGTDCQLMKLPSDVVLYSSNILEATRAIYDKFVATDDILQVNIGHEARVGLDTFYGKHSDIRQIIAAKATNKTNEPDRIRAESIESGHSPDSPDSPPRTTTVVVDDGNRNVMVEKYNLFCNQLQNETVENIEVIQEMVNAYNNVMKDCWSNACDSFSRFRTTADYKINSSFQSYSG